MQKVKSTAKALLLTLFFGSPFSLASHDANAEIAIIGNPDGKCKNLSPQELQKLYLAKERACNDQAIQLGEPSVASESRKEFLQKVVLKSASEYKAYWSVLIFTGRARPPIEFRNENDLKAWVAENPNAIGYIKTESVDNTVSVLGIIK